MHDDGSAHTKTQTMKRSPANDSLTMCQMGSGKKDVARELGMKSREHDRLAVEARARANGVAYDGFNRQLLNRWKVRHLCALWTVCLKGGCHCQLC